MRGEERTGGEKEKRVEKNMIMQVCQDIVNYLLEKTKIFSSHVY